MKEIEKMSQVSAQTAREKFRELLNNAEVKGEETAITRYGKPVAVLVPAGTWARMVAALTEQDTDR
ncbi:type II toxin-antitoxin system Phd/YefM family antitoxin [Streptomyces sp. NPDC101115]|uniref:type II toxin-antitoxin system Phd/YefM family antitoxin n=1 Tax=Streptomyces sp. NPDC101115 TaxID=3366106 RepID=UPI003816B7F3